MPIDFAALRTEILEDPEALGYAVHHPSPPGDGNLEALAAKLNAPRPSVPTVPVSLLTRDAIRAQFTSADLTQIQTNSAADRTWLNFALDAETIDPRVGVFQAELLRILNGTGLAACRARIIAIATKRPSRAEQLFGQDTIVTHHHLGDALATITQQG